MDKLSNLGGLVLDAQDAKSRWFLETITNNLWWKTETHHKYENITGVVFFKQRFKRGATKNSLSRRMTPISLQEAWLQLNDNLQIHLGVKSCLISFFFLYMVSTNGCRKQETTTKCGRIVHFCQDFPTIPQMLSACRLFAFKLSLPRPYGGKIAAPNQATPKR